MQKKTERQEGKVEIESLEKSALIEAPQSERLDLGRPSR